MSKAFTPNIKSKKGKDLTKYVTKFIYRNKYKNIPQNVIELACLLYTSDAADE